MDRSDADQEGITLPPIHATALIARREAEKVILEHLRLCPFAELKIEERLRKLELNLMALIGYMTGAGIFGGAAAAVVGHLLKH